MNIRHTFLPFLLLAGSSIVADPARASLEPFRLDRIGIVRFIDLGNGQLRREAGVLLVDETIQWRAPVEVARPEGLPDWALGRPLIARDSWLAYYALGGGALQNFELQEGGVLIPAGNEWFWAVGVNAFPYTASGRLINVSTRARVAGPGEPVIAGFVIEERPRIVLVRVVGPSLADLGVTDAAADTFLRVKQGSTQLATNNDWPALPDAAEMLAAAARVGAFPLRDDSLDAAQLITLPPGEYTVWGEVPPDTAGGSLLIEVYAVPEEY